MTKLGDLPSIGTLPSDAQPIIHSEIELTRDRLTAAGALLTDYSQIESVETIKNKIFDSSTRSAPVFHPLVLSRRSSKREAARALLG